MNIEIFVAVLAALVAYRILSPLIDAINPVVAGNGQSAGGKSSAGIGILGGNSTLLERRLYELARKHVEDQQKWIASEENLYLKSGSNTTKSEFNRLLTTIIADNKIPGYSLSWYESGTEEKQVRFIKVQS